MNSNSQAIIILCSYLSADESRNIKPLTPSEWSKFARYLIERKLEPKDILHFSEHDLISRLECDKSFAERLMRLIDRSGSLQFEVNRYVEMGINIFTRADSEYPRCLKKKLGAKCPPLFYCAGDMKILSDKFAGWEGSREINEDDKNFTHSSLMKTFAHGFNVISGGARGIDSIASETALAEGMRLVEYVSCGLLGKIKIHRIAEALRSGKMLILSAAVPNAGFNTGMAMSRNKYIYASSEFSVIIKSELNKGGTWAGAVENLVQKWCPELCRDVNYPGNQELIKRGALPINENWDGTLPE